MRVPFDQLPPHVKKAVTAIREHRRNVFRVGSVYTSLMAGAFSFLFSISGFSPTYLIFPAIGVPVPAYLLLRSHDPEFKEEYLRLFHALKDNRNSPILRPLFNNPKSNYLKVNRDGSLEIGYKNPRKFLGIPIGRRHVVKPNAPRGIRERWKRAIEYRTELTRQRRRK